MPASEFRTTLTNGNIRTLTRSDEPYETSFGQQTLTVCPSGDTCRISTETKTSTEDDTSTQTTETSDQENTATSSVIVYPLGTAGQTTATSPSSSSNTDVGQEQSNDSSTPPAGTIAGGVVGGAAGIAILLLIALIFLWWYKRRQQQRHHALPASSSMMSPDPDYPPPSSRHPGMAERAGLRPLVGAVPGFFRHQNPSSEEPASSERGFTKVSGRKLPSQFSEGMSSGGMSSPPPTMPLTSIGSSEERNLSSHSFYRDRDGFHGGEGDAYQMSESPPRDYTAGREYGNMVLSPGPQRTPTIHQGGPYNITPGTSAPSTPVHPAHRPLSPPGTMSSAGGQQTMMRSETPSTVTDNRSSRFTEEV